MEMELPNPPQSVDSDRLEVLLADYAQVREEERHYATQQTTLTAITLTAVTLAAAIGFNSGKSGIAVPAAWHDPVFFVTPLLAVVPLLFLVQIGTAAVWRSYYIRALERDIRALLVDSRLHSYPTLPMVSYGELHVTDSAGRGPGSPGVVKVLASITYPIVVLVVGGLAGAMASHIKLLPLQLLMFLIYGAGAVALIVHIARVHLRGREAFEQQVKVVNERLRDGLLPDRLGIRRRSPTSYFLLPRPDELVSKSVFLVLGVLLAVAQLPDIEWPTRIDLLNLFLLWVAIEFLIYQARYQWNDIIGIREDRASSTARARGRLPIFLGNRPLSWLVILFRICLVIVAASVPLGTGNWNIRLTPAVWFGLLFIGVVAVLYELIRGWLRMTRACTPLQLSLLCFVVGLGYAARLAIGYIAVGVSFGPVLIAAAVAAWALGVYFVSLTWLIEAAWNFNWDIEGKRAVSVLQNVEHAKPHLTALLRRTGVQLPLPWLEVSDGLAERTPRLVLRLVDLPRIPVLPVGTASAVWFLAIGGTGGMLVDLKFQTWWWLTAIAGVLGAAAAVVPAKGRFQRWSLILAAVPITICYPILFAITGLNSPVDWIKLVICVLLAFVPFALFTLFEKMNYEDSRAFVAKIGIWIGRLALAIYDIVSGVNPRRRCAKVTPELSDRYTEPA